MLDPVAFLTMTFLTSSTGVPRLMSGPSSPIIFAVFAASCDTSSSGFASIFLERSLAAGVVESEYGRHCDGENRVADRAGHCPRGWGLSGIDRAKGVMDSRGGMALLCLALCYRCAIQRPEEIRYTLA
jgi:hypothetical protein